MARTGVERQFRPIEKRLLCWLVFALCAVMPGARLAAQNFEESQAAPAGRMVHAPSNSIPDAPTPSRVDLFAGYSYLVPTKGAIAGYEYQSLKEGAIGSVAIYFNRYVGVQVEGSYHVQSVRNGFETFAAGPIVRIPLAHGVTPFFHALAGGSLATGPNVPTIGTSSFFFNPQTWGLNLTGGGGLDVRTPLLNNKLSLRLFQADYQYMHPNFGPLQKTTGGVANIQAVRLSSGLVYGIGSAESMPPVALSCSASPARIYPGDQLIVTGIAANLNPSRPVSYSWTPSAGKVTSSGASVRVDTFGVPPGSYTVSGHVSQGAKQRQFADCTAEYVIQAFQPVTLSCSANPASVIQGAMSTITAQGFSPQNRPLTYSYGTSGGTIQGSGTTATLATEGATPGPVLVTCNVVDDKGQAAAAIATVTVQALQPLPRPQTESLCSIVFDRDKKRPTRVDNEAKACLDQVALSLQRSPAAKAVLVGSSDAGEAGGTALAAQRAVNTKAYLVTEKGIDPARIQARTTGAAGKKVSNYLLPEGADFPSDVLGTIPVDPGVVPQVRLPLATRHAATAAHPDAAGQGATPGKTTSPATAPAASAGKGAAAAKAPAGGKAPAPAAKLSSSAKATPSAAAAHPAAPPKATPAAAAKGPMAGQSKPVQPKPGQTQPVQPSPSPTK